MSLLCPGYDTTRFARECRAPLYPGRVNTWKIWVSAAYDFDTAAVTRGTWIELKYWFGQSLGAALEHAPLDPDDEPLGGGRRADQIDHLTVDVEPPAAPLEPVTNWLQICDIPMSLKHSDGDPIPVWAQFIYRGAHQSIPWLIEAGPVSPDPSGVLIRPDVYCSDNVTRLLDTVYEPLDPVTPPGRVPTRPWLGPQNEIPTPLEGGRRQISSDLVSKPRVKLPGFGSWEKSAWTGAIILGVGLGTALIVNQASRKG